MPSLPGATCKHFDGDIRYGTKDDVLDTARNAPHVSTR